MIRNLFAILAVLTICFGSVQAELTVETKKSSTASTAETFSLSSPTSAKNANENSAAKFSTPKVIYSLENGQIIQKSQVDSLSKSWEGLAMKMGKMNVDTVQIILYPKVSEGYQQGIDNIGKQEDDLEMKLLGKMAPEFKAKDIKGNLFSLSESKGKVVVLNFWSTACKPCIAEMPELNALTRRYHSKDVIFLAIAFNTKAEIDDFLLKNTFDYNIISDAKSITKKYGIDAWPSQIVISKEGKVNFTQVGANDVQTHLINAIDQSLK